jgi:uncharacterized membrane protein YcaP (DUF421 family)
MDREVMESVPLWLEIVLRTLLTIVFLLICTRIVGKKQITQLSYFEYITGITLGSMAAYTSLDRELHWGLPLLGIFTWVIALVGAEYLTLKSKLARDLIEGKGTVFIKDGKILEDNLKKERYSTDELLSQLRQHNAFRAADVEFAVLETTGQLSVKLKSENEPITPAKLGIKVPSAPEPQTVIMDGKIMDEPLATIGLNRAWLHTELEKIGVALENVFLAQVDGYGQLYVDVYDDKLQIPAPSSLALLWANLKKCEADLELFSLSTQNQEAKEMYASAAEKLKQQLDCLRPYLTRA